MATQVEQYNAQNLALVKDEIAKLEADLRLLQSALEEAETANSPYDKVRSQSHLGTVAAKIKEKRLLGDRQKCHIVQISPRRYNVVKLSSVLGNKYCEFDTVKHNLEWKQAKLYAEVKNIDA